MSSAYENAISYSSLDALRVAHDELLEGLPDDEAALPAETRRANDARISEFIRRAVDSGAQLDSPADRKVAQGLIDYWVASAYAASRQRSFSRPLPSRADLVLKPFDAAKVAQAAQRADAFIETLNAQDEELARRIVMHLVRLSGAGEPCRVAPRERNKLLSLGNVQRADLIVGELIKAGALRVSQAANDDRVELSYEALTRQWPRLRDWIADRARFRKWAQGWDESGRDSGALISNRKLLKQTDAFDDLGKLELEYKQESIKALDKLRRTRIWVAVVIALVVIGLIPGYRELVKLGEERDTKKAEADFRENVWTVKSKDAKPDQKLAAFKWLDENQPRLRAELRLFDFSGAILTDLDLNGISMRDTNFTNATLKGVSFDRSNLPAARFINNTIMEGAPGSGAQPRNARFVSAVITSGRFDGSMLSSVKFNGARLNYSSFDRVRFCNGVDFSGADIRMASFQNVIFDSSSSVPILKNTVWWLSDGWSLDQVGLLSTRFADVRVTETTWFDDEMREHDVNIRHSADDTVDRADALNGKAWALTTHGVSDNGFKEAEEIAQKAIGIAIKLSLAKKILANLEDTLAYIRLQQDETAEAVKLLGDAVASNTNPDILFRYAVALNAVGRTDEAIDKLNKSVSTISGNYSPSHELFLLRKYINGEFKITLKKLLEERRTPDISRPPLCPSTERGSQ